MDLVDIRKGETEKENATNVREYLQPGQPWLLLLFLAHLRTSNIPKMPNAKHGFLIPKPDSIQRSQRQASCVMWRYYREKETLSNIDLDDIDNYIIIYRLQVYTHMKNILKLRLLPSWIVKVLSRVWQRTKRRIQCLYVHVSWSCQPSSEWSS